MNATALEMEYIRPALTELSEEETQFKMSVREFAEGEIRPRVEQMEHAAKLDKDLIKHCFELGLMAIETPEEYGGAGSSMFNAILAIEEIARVDASVSVFVDVQNTLVTNAFIRWGSDDLKKKYLPQMAESRVGAYALSEASSGSDAFALKTKAVDRGDHWEINGQKLWITNGNEAEIFIVFATIDQSAGYKGITAFIVEKDYEGFSVGKKEDKLGIRASSTTELIFDNCKVPKENVLGEVGKGYKVSIETLNEGRIGIGAQMVGIAQGAYEAALELHQRTRTVRQKNQRFPSRPISTRGNGDGHRSRAFIGLQRRPFERRGQTVLKRSGDGESLFVAHGGTSFIESHRTFRRLRLRQRLSGRKILARFQNRRDLRRHVKYAAGDDCEIDYEREINGNLLQL